MKTFHVIIGIVFLFLVVVLSGCNESNIEDRNNSYDIDIVNYTVITNWTIWEENESTIYQESGFIHNYPENTYPRYIINVTVKNNAEGIIPIMLIWAKFCDENNNELWKQFGVISNLSNTYSKTVTIEMPKIPSLLKIYIDAGIYFDCIEKVRFEFERLPRNTFACKQAVGLGYRYGVMTIDPEGVHYFTKTMDDFRLIPWEAIERWQWVGYADSIGFYWHEGEETYSNENISEYNEYFSFRIQDEHDQIEVISLFRKFIPMKEKT